LKKINDFDNNCKIPKFDLTKNTILDLITYFFYEGIALLVNSVRKDRKIVLKFNKLEYNAFSISERSAVEIIRSLYGLIEGVS